MDFLIVVFLLVPALSQDTSICPAEVAQHYCFDATCGVQLADDVVKDHLNCECTNVHIGYDFTACDPDTNTLSMFYFWKPPATCRGGTAELKPPVHNIPCTTSCKPGRRYAVEQTPPKCEECAAGTYGMSGGMSYDPPWSYLPPQFSSNCIGGMVSSWAPPVVCNAWRPMESYLDSGDNYEKANIENVLTYQIELVKPGRVEFEYKYDAEDRYDIFQLFVDGDKPFEATVSVLSWKTASVNLTGPGFHTLRWVYKKDGSLSKGADKAFIRSIKIYGVRQFDAECLLCPPGRYTTDPGKEVCTPCPQDTHSSHYGAQKCEPCHEWEKAFPGAASCSPRLPCTDTDYFQLNGQCVGGKRNITYQWIAPIKCETSSAVQGSEFFVGSSENNTKVMRVEFLQPFLEIPTNVSLEALVAPWAIGADSFELVAFNITETDFLLQITRVNVPAGVYGWGEQLRVRWSARVLSGVELPASRQETCAPPTCKVGQELDGSGTCVFCPSGRATSSAGPGTPCVACGQGEGAQKYVAYADWGISKGRSTGCSGDCGTAGWRYSGNFIDSGAGHGVGANSWFSYAVPNMPAGVDLEYRLSCPEEGGYLEVAVDSIIIKRFNCMGCSDAVVKASVAIDPSIFEGKEKDFVLTINFHKSAILSYQHSCDVAQMYSLALFGSKVGIGGGMGGDGAVLCDKCGKGRSSVGATCMDCPAGRFQDMTGTDVCNPCPPGQFAYKSGLSSCLNCGTHTVPNADRNDCEGSCKMSIEGTNYDVSPLFPGQWEVPAPGLDPRFTYFLIMCDASPPYVCQKLKDDKWTEIPSQVTQPRPLHMCVNRMGVDESGLDVRESVNAGAVIGYGMLDANRPMSPGTPFKPSNDRSGVSVSMSAGASVLCRLSDGSNTTKPLESYVHFVCDANGGYGDPVDVTPSLVKLDLNFTTLVPCVTHMEWVSAYACPVCTINDMNSFDTACTPAELLDLPAGKGTSTRSWHWKEPKTCMGGLALPDPNTTIGCDYVEPVPDSHIVMGKGAVAALAVTGTLIAIAAIVAVVYLLRKKRTLEQDNQNLRHYAQLGDNQTKPKVPDVVELHTS